jgi:FtsX-like permease family protein
VNKGAKIAIAVLGVAVVALVIVVVVLAESSGGGSKKLRKEVPIADLARLDAAIVLPPSADANDISRVEHALDGSDAVSQFAKLTPSQLLLNLTLEPVSEDRRVNQQVCATRTTRSFVVSTTDDGGHARSALTRVAGPKSTVDFNVSMRPQVEIFMRVKATSAQDEAVLAMLRHDPRVTSTQYLNHQDAYNEFFRLFSDRPDLIHAEPRDGSGLPASFRLVLHPGVAPQAIEHDYGNVPGVDMVSTPHLSPNGSTPTLHALCDSALTKGQNGG